VGEVRIKVLRYSKARTKVWGSSHKTSARAGPGSILPLQKHMGCGSYRLMSSPHYPQEELVLLKWVLRMMYKTSGLFSKYFSG